MWRGRACKGDFIYLFLFLNRKDLERTSSMIQWYSMIELIIDKLQFSLSS